MFVKNPMDVMQIAFLLRSLETNSDVSGFSIDVDKMFDSAVAFDPGFRMLVLNPIMIPQGWCSFAAAADDQHHQKQDKHSIFQEKTQFLQRPS